MLLLTGYNDHQAPLGDLTAPLMETYAKRHRLGFRCVRFAATGKEAYWQKIIETLRAFDEGFDRVFWLDADQMITNPELGFESDLFSDALFAPKDWGVDATEVHHFSMCGYIASLRTRDLFEIVNARHDVCIDGDFPEQTPMRDICQSLHRICQFGRRVLNAVPDEVSPGNVVEPWQPGDFAAHLTMRPVEERVALFHEIARRIQL